MSRKKAPYGMAEEKGLVLFVVDYGNLHVDSVLLVLWWLICICRQLIVRIKMLLFCFQYRYAFCMTLLLLKLHWQKKINKFMFYENTREQQSFPGMAGGQAETARSSGFLAFVYNVPARSSSPSQPLRDQTLGPDCELLFMYSLSRSYLTGANYCSNFFSSSGKHPMCCNCLSNQVLFPSSTQT